MDAEWIYELSRVSYSYLDRLPGLKAIDLRIKKGERVALLGANGSGKSTLLLVLAGLIFPKQGQVRFFGQELNEDHFADSDFGAFFRSQVGIVFQNPEVQLFNSNVEDELLFGLQQLDLPTLELAERLEKNLVLMNLLHLRERHPQYLSMGEKKRVAIASVLAMAPEVLLLDEPTAGLDPRNTRHLIDTIWRLGEKGETVITSTQDIHLVPELADRVIVLTEDKQIARDGRVGEVLKDRELLETHNLVHVHAHRHEGVTHVHPHEHPDHHHSHGEGPSLSLGLKAHKD